MAYKSSEINAPGYLLESTRIQQIIRGIFPLHGSDMVKIHFVNDSLTSLILDQNSMEDTRGCLDIFVMPLELWLVNEQLTID